LHARFSVSAYSKGLIFLSGHSSRVCLSKRPARSNAELSGREAESLSVNIGVACVDMVRAKLSRKLGPGILAFSPRGILFPNIRGAAVKDQESTRVDDPYYASCYHETGRAIARIAHFLQRKSGIRKDWPCRGVRRLTSTAAPYSARRRFCRVESARGLLRL
jgi:hypothetical protein